MSAAEPLRALMYRYAPGRSVKELCAAAGVSEQRLAYWLKPGTELSRMPTLAQLREIARIIGGNCPVPDVYDALRRMVDGDCELIAGLAEDERKLLTLYRRMTPGDRQRLVNIAQVLHE